jgi:hypothetical protein
LDSVRIPFNPCAASPQVGGCPVFSQKKLNMLRRLEMPNLQSRQSRKPQQAM